MTPSLPSLFSFTAPSTYRLADSKFEWWLQSWKQGNKAGYTSAQVREVRKLLRELPTPLESNGGAGYTSVGLTKAKDNNTSAFVVQDRLSPHLKIQSIKSWILNEAKSTLLQGVDQELIDELIAGYDNFQP